MTALENSTKVEVLEGQPVELLCPVKGAPTPRVRWSHNGQEAKSAAQAQGRTLRWVQEIYLKTNLQLLQSENGEGLQ